MRPQDIIILLKLISSKNKGLSNKEMAEELKISASEFSEALERCKQAHLIDSTKSFVNTLALEEFLIHGIKYVFPVVKQSKIRGIATSISAPLFKNRIMQGQDLYVWKFPTGEIRGEEIKPLYKTVPEASINDPKLYELLVITDVLRMGKAREIDIAKEELKKRFTEYTAREFTEN